MPHPTEDTVGNIVKMMIFSIGEQEFCLPILAVREVTKFEKIRPLPFSAACICGVMNLRGHAIKVIDLAVYLNIPPQSDNCRRVVIIVENEHEVVQGFLVDQVSDMLDVDLDTIQVSSDGRGSGLQGLVTIENRMIGVLNANSISSTSEGVALEYQTTQ